MNETNLEEVKQVAIAFLNIQPEPVKEFPLFLTHPIFEDSMMLLPSNKISGKIEIFNIFEEPEKYKQLIKFTTDRIHRCASVASVFLIIRKQYRLTFFKYVNQYLSSQDFSEMLLISWIHDENPSNDVNVTQKDLLKWFKRADKQYMFDEEDKNDFISLPEKFTIYRGVQDKSFKQGLSWTLDKEKAKWFAERFHRESESCVYQLEINKENVLCYTNQRDEKEVIIDISKINNKDIKEI